MWVVGANSLNPVLQLSDDHELHSVLQKVITAANIRQSKVIAVS